MNSSGDAQTLYIVCDTSGSMSENGKRMRVRGIARTIEQYIRLGYGNISLKLIVWNTTASLLEWNPDDEFSPMIFECYGPSNADALCALFDSIPKGKILLLADCCWSRDDANVLKRWQRKLAPDTLKIIKIGSDTVLLQKKENIFSPDEILSALEDWLPPCDSIGNNDEADEW